MFKTLSMLLPAPVHYCRPITFIVVKPAFY